MPVFWMAMLVMTALLVGEEHPPERPVEPWPDPKPVPERVVTRKINWNKKGKSTSRPPWYDHARKNTIEWQDFLEELDEKGIMLSDPDAIELWEKDYD